MATVKYAIKDNWGSGFIGNMTVDGGTSGTHGWTVEFDAGFAITNIWGAEIVSHVGTHYVLRNASYNANVSPGGNITFGFQATPGATGGTAATGLSLNGDGSVPAPVLPTLSVGDASIVEGNSGTKQMVFTVSLSKAATGPVKVDFATANGTACRSTANNTDRCVRRSVMPRFIVMTQPPRGTCPPPCDTADGSGRPTVPGRLH